MITVCLTYFRSLGLANLDAALYSLRQQNFSRVDSICILDNNTDDAEDVIRKIVERQIFPVRVRLISCKHGDATKTQSWSTNANVREVRTPWVFYTRADYILDFDILTKFAGVVDEHPEGWRGFIVGHGYHLNLDVGECEKANWRQSGPHVLRNLSGSEIQYTNIDAGVWMARRQDFDAVGGLDEDLTAWGHAQTLFQYQMYVAGVEFVKIPRVLFYHPIHAGDRDLALAHRQLQDMGIDVRKLWERYDGVNPY